MKGVNKYIIVLSFKRQVCFCDDFKAGNDQRQVAELHGGNEIQLNMPNHSSQLKKAIGHFFFKEEPGYKYLSLKEFHLQLNIVIRQSTPLLVTVICRSCEDSQPVASEGNIFRLSYNQSR